MRSTLPAFFLTALLFSCSSDPKTVVPPVDSTHDTTSVVLHPDTLAADTGSNPHYDCSVLKRRIPDINNETQIRIDLGDLSHCGVDSFDILYVVPNLFPGYVSENQTQGIKNVTYADFMKHLAEFRTTPAYTQLHQRVQTLDSLRSTKFDQRKVYAMKPVLGKLGFTEPEWEMFSGFANTYPVPQKGVFTWGNMLDAFEKYNSKNQK